MLAVFDMQTKNCLVTAFLACSFALSMASCSTLGVSDLGRADTGQVTDTSIAQSENILLFIAQTDEVIEPVNASSLSPSSVVNFEGANSIVWLPDSQGAALAGEQSVLLLPTAQSGTGAQANIPQIVHTITATLPSLMYAAQETAILTWVSDGETIQILDLTAAPIEPIVTLSAAPVTGLTLTPSGERMAYATFDSQVVTQQPGDDPNAQHWKAPAWLANLSYSPDARQLAGADLANFKLYFLDAGTGEVVRSLEWSDSATSALYGVYLSPDWNRAAWVSQGAVQLMDVRDGQSGPLLAHPNVVNAIAWSPDSRLVATGAATMVEGSLVPAVLIWEASSGELLNSLIQLEAVRCLAFSPDGRQLAVLTTSGSLQTWSVSR